MPTSIKGLFGVPVLLSLLGVCLLYSGIDRLQRPDPAAIEEGLGGRPPLPRFLAWSNSGEGRTTVWAVAIVTPAICLVGLFRPGRDWLAFGVMTLWSVVIAIYGFWTWLGALLF